MCQRSFIKVLVVGLLIAMGGWSQLLAVQPDNVAMKAYELRMQGKADEAKAALEQAISQDPDNAAAHYELARTLWCLAVGGNRQGLEKCLEQAKNSIEKATELDPNNGAYILFEGGVAFIYAYMATHKGGEEAKEKVGKLCRILKRAIKANPGSLTPMLHLVEIYGTLPEENGGDKSMAQEYAKKLEKLDNVFGAKARSILLPDDADRVAYWENILKEHQGNAEVMEELGKSCLYSERYEEGIKYIEEAIKADPRKKILLLDLARFHMYRVMNGDGPKEEILAAAEKAAKRYLDTDPIPPMKAYTLEIMAKLKFGMNDKEAVAELREKAAKIDPNHSKATGLPGQDLFLPPDKVPTEHRYLFRPF